MGFMDKLQGVLGIDDDYDEEEITKEEIEAEKAQMAAARGESIKMEHVEPAPTGINYKREYESIAPQMSRGSMNKNYSMNGTAPFKMLVIEPKSFDECTTLVDNLKSRKPVIINLERVETDLAKKMFDFLSGATYALNGNVQRVTANIFIFAPANVDIAAKMNNRDTSAQPAARVSKDKSPWE